MADEVADMEVDKVADIVVKVPDENFFIRIWLMVIFMEMSYNSQRSYNIQRSYNSHRSENSQRIENSQKVKISKRSENGFKSDLKR